MKEATAPEIWLTSPASMIPPVYTIYGREHKLLRCRETAFNPNTYEFITKLEKLLKEIKRSWRSSVSSSQKSRKFGRRKCMLLKPVLLHEFPEFSRKTMFSTSTMNLQKVIRISFRTRKDTRLLYPKGHSLNTKEMVEWKKAMEVIV